MRPRMLVAMSTLLLALAWGSASAADPHTTSSEQAVILFTKSCMAFAGQRDRLRAWTAGQGMSQTPPDIAAKLMGEHLGQAFSMTTPSGSFIIGSQDDGGCTLFVQHADGKTVEARLEEIVGLSKLNLKVTSDHDDAQNAAIHHKGYEITGEHRTWLVVVSSTPPGTHTVDAIMTAYSWSARPAPN